MGPGEHIKALREERGLRPADVERLSQRLADDLRNPDYVIPHATLNGIESGSTPTIFKLAALAAVLAVRVEHLLLLYGIDITQQRNRGETGARIESAARRNAFRNCCRERMESEPDADICSPGYRKMECSPSCDAHTAPCLYNAVPDRFVHGL